MSAPLKPARLFALDALRVFAIGMMIVFHFLYDLRYFGYVDWDTPTGNGFRQWRSFIVFCFVFTMGMSMGVAHGHSRNRRAFLKRLAQIAACAALISVVSLILFPDSYIYFGILHFMVIAGALCYALVGRVAQALILGALILIAFWAGYAPYRWPFAYITSLPSYTEDYAALFPWLGVALLGLAAGEGLIKRPAALAYFARWQIGGRLGKIITAAGKRSLLIYMIHQPILFAGFYGAAFLGAKP